MARNITITLEDGSTHVYRNAPDSITPEQVTKRAQQEFGLPVKAIDGGRAKPDVSDSSLVAVGAGIGKGVGTIALNAQRYAGKGINALTDFVSPPQQSITSLITGKKTGGNAVGNWLVQDAEQGLKKIEGELAPYKKVSPIAAGGGELAGEIVATLPVGGVLGKAVGAGATALGPQVAARAAPLVNSLTTSGFKAGTTPGAANMLTRMAGGGVTGATSAALVDPDSAAAGGAIGGALPLAGKVVGTLGKQAGKALRGAPVSDEVAALAQRAKELGIEVPADRIVNSKPLNAVAASLNYVPLSGRAAVEEKMQSQLNRALSRTFGQESDNVTASLRKAGTELGDKFDNVLSSNKVKVDEDLVSELATHRQTALDELSPDQAAIITKQIDNLLAKGAAGEIDGQTAYNIKKTLDRIGRRNSPEAYYASDLKQSLMGALNRSLGPEEAKAFAKTRQQYGNMLTLEKMAQNGAEGDISIARLANLKNIRNKELQELADIAAQFLKARESNHGAMQRTMVAGVAGMSGVGIPALAAGAALGRGTNKLLNSNVARNALLNPQSLPMSPVVGGLLEGGFRSAPVIGAQ